MFCSNPEQSLFRSAWRIAMVLEGIVDTKLSGNVSLGKAKTGTNRLHIKLMRRSFGGRVGVVEYRFRWDVVGRCS